MTTRAASFMVLMGIGLLCPMPVGAQTSSSEIFGFVADPSGAGVPGAAVEVRNLENGVERKALTDESGYFSLVLLPPGQYRVSAGRDAFRPVIRSHIRLEVNQILRLDIALAIGTVHQSVDVTELETLLQEGSSELGTVIDQKAILDLPLNGRDFQQLMSLTSGINGRSVNGQWGNGDLYQLDGVNNNNVINDTNNPTAALVPILDSIQEFKVQSHNDLAEFGGVLGGIVNVVSKSGTNVPHGSAWEFLRNDALNARDPFSDALRSRPPAFRQNQFGATFGGPVFLPRKYDGRSRTFFFFGYEGGRDRRPSSVFSRVPTAEELSGDFSDSIARRRIYDPATERLQAGGAGTFVRDPFPGNRIPPSRISPVMAADFALVFDRPNYTSDAFYNRLSDFPNIDNQDNYTIKIDHELTPQNHLWIRYSQAGEWRQTHQTEKVFQPWTYQPRNLAISWARTFHSKAILDSRFSRTAHATKARNIIGSPSAGLYGDTGSLVAAGFGADKIERFSLFDTVLSSPWSGTGILGETVNAGSQPFSASESVTVNLGGHAVRFGAQLLRSRFDNVGRGHRAVFLDAQTGLPQQVGTTGASLASALLGLPGRVGFATNLYTEAFNTWGFFVQDRWNPRPSLTLNWGLRYDQYPTVSFTKGMINTWDFKTGDWLIGATQLPPPCSVAGRAPCIPGTGTLTDLPFGNHIRLADYGPGVRRPIRDNIGPRIGVAWRLLPHVVLRAGYGLFFDVFSSTAQEMQNPSNTWPYADGIREILNGVGQRPRTIDQIQHDPLAVLPDMTPWGTTTWFWDPRKKNGASHQWNVELQRQLTGDLMGAIAYVGSVSSRLDMNIAANSASSPGQGSVEEVSARKPFPYMATTMYGTDWGRASYHAMQLKLRKVYSAGLQFLFAYSWSKSMDNGTSNWYSRGPQDGYHPSTSWAPSNYDRTHSVVLSGIYELPVGPSRRWLNRGALSSVIGNWQFNTIVTLQSGTPFDLLVPGDVANVGNSVKDYERPNLTGNPLPAVQTAARWYNPSAFAVPSFAFGNFGRNVLRAAPMYNSDLSVFRVLRPERRVSGELRIEFFNAFNLMNLGSPEIDITSENAGRITRISGAPRQVQMALKVRF